MISNTLLVKETVLWYFVSNIPSKIFYPAYRAEILKIARVTSTKTIFINHRSTLISRIKS